MLYKLKTSPRFASPHKENLRAFPETEVLLVLPLPTAGARLLLSEET